MTPRQAVLALVAAASTSLRPPALLAAGPLRPVTGAARRAVLRSTSWESRQPWIGPLSAGRERALVTVAVDTVARIAASGAWSSEWLDTHRLRLDLADELDQIDAAAFRLASRPVDDAAWAGRLWLAAVDRVAALHTYAGHLAALDHQLAGATTPDAEDRAGELAVEQVRNEQAATHLEALTAELHLFRATIEPR